MELARTGMVELCRDCSLAVYRGEGCPSSFLPVKPANRGRIMSADISK